MEVRGVRNSGQHVGQEPPEAILGGGPFGKGHLDSVDHRVERLSQLTDLGPPGDVGHPLGQIATGDDAGRPGDLLEGAQIGRTIAHERKPKPSRTRADTMAWMQQELTQGAVHVGQRYGDEDGAGAVSSSGLASTRYGSGVPDPCSMERGRGRNERRPPTPARRPGRPGALGAFSP